MAMARFCCILSIGAGSLCTAAFRRVVAVEPRCVNEHEEEDEDNDEVVGADGATSPSDFFQDPRPLLMSHGISPEIPMLLVGFSWVSYAHVPLEEVLCLEYFHPL